MVTPLRFPPAAPPAPAATKGPRPLAFAPAPAAPTQPIKQAGEVRAVFQQTLSPIAKSAVAELKHSFPDEYAKRGPLLERQINQLLPLDLSKVLSWAGKSLTNSSEVASQCAKLVRDFISADGNRVIDETMKIVTGKQSFFEKFSNRSGDVTTKPQLAVLKSSNVTRLTMIDELTKEAELAAERLINKMTSLRVIASVCGNLPDVSLANALHERQVLIAQATTQSQLTIQQLKDVRMQIVDQMARIDQLLITTIPAYENVKARR